MQINGEKFYFIRILGGTQMDRAQELCNKVGMKIFEPRDATTNSLVWEKAQEYLYPMSNGYWLNIKRSIENPM